MNSSEIRYLGRQEKERTMELWREAFPEDSESFLAYYYEEKTRDNRVLVLEDHGGARILSMVHRNPYTLQVGAGRLRSDYIVAVATASDRRGRGYMRRLLTRMVEDMYREAMAFCYLMPADRRIYEPFGFAYVYDQEHWKLTQEAEERLIKRRAGREDAEAVGAWMNRWLAERYQVFAVRDEAYTARLLKELESEKGRMELLYESESDRDGGEPAGIRCLWGVEKQEQRMLLCGPEYREKEREASPAIMARIIDVRRCLEMICLKKDSPLDAMEVILHIEDGLCPWNQGTFLWKLGHGSSEVVKQSEDRTGESAGAAKRREREDKRRRLDLGIHQLAQWIFGYRDVPEPGWDTEEKEDGWRQNIGIWRGVFLDEVV